MKKDETITDILIKDITKDLKENSYILRKDIIRKYQHKASYSMITRTLQILRRYHNVESFVVLKDGRYRAYRIKD